MILVGVDGSPASRKALRWALEEATRTGATVEATMAWRRQPAIVPASSLGVHPYAEVPHQRHPEQELHAIVEEVRAGVPEAPPVVEVTTTDAASDALVEGSRKADLLVVGTRGHGPVVGMVLGSVAADCVRRAACPVVALPPHLP